MNLDNVHFIDFKNKDILKEYYYVADVFVLPTREDIWGLVINEALAYGLPVITTDKCMAGLEMIEDGKNGYIIPVNSVKKLAEKLTFKSFFPVKILRSWKNLLKKCQRPMKKYCRDMNAAKHKYLKQ